MRLPPLDLAPTRRLLVYALLVALVVAAVLVRRDAGALRFGLGDTDDAMRLVMVRQLLHGRGWWDQLQTRLQPPGGVWMHWSRLLDGGIALLDRGFALFAPPPRAEFLTRIVWPLLWIPPATAAVMLAARRLAARSPHGARTRGLAVLAAGVLVLAGLGPLTVQFYPGRVDHHDVQITLSLVVLAGTLASGVRGAAVAGAATGLGLAIGLEALLFEAALAASLGLRVLLDRRQAPQATAFGLALTGATVAAFLVQTPPLRWGAVACDALGLNLVVGAALAGSGLAAAAWTARLRPWPWRLAALSLAAAVALGAYLGLDPGCLRGVFADVDPAIRPFWLDHVNEVKRWPVLWKDSRGDAVVMALTAAMGLGAWAALGLAPARRRDPAWWSLGGALLLAVAAAWTAVRMRSYLEWFAIAPLAVAAGELGAWSPRLGRTTAAVAAAVFTPVVVAGLLLVIAAAAGPVPLWTALALATGLVAGGFALWRLAPAGAARRWCAPVGVLAVLVAGALTAAVAREAAPPRKPAPRGDGPDRCYQGASYDVLARLPRGVTVSEVDFGPMVLAHTPSASMTAPYHRMSRGILAARAVMASSVDAARDRALAVSAGGRLGPVYVLECRRHARHSDRGGLVRDSLQVALDRGEPPAWLDRMSPAGAPLEVYRVRPRP